MKPKLSIVIPALNEEKDIVGCLESIARQDVQKSLFEVIVVDNYSSDNTVKIANSFKKRINLRVLKNKIMHGESSKKVGFCSSRGELFMYLDADMRFADSQFIRKMLLPFKLDERICGNFVNFKVNPSQPALTRTLSYDEFQRDPIFKFFTLGIEDIVKKKNKNFWLCYCAPGRVPPQGLMIYKRKLIMDYIKDKPLLLDNEIPAVLVDKGQHYFAFVPSTGVEHLLLRSLKELWKKRVRNLERVYYPNVSFRKFKWINWKKDWPKVMLWMIYTNSLFLPEINALIKTIKHRDVCFLNEPALNLISTYAIIFGVLSNLRRKK